MKNSILANTQIVLLGILISASGASQVLANPLLFPPSPFTSVIPRRYVPTIAEMYDRYSQFSPQDLEHAYFEVSLKIERETRKAYATIEVFDDMGHEDPEMEARMRANAQSTVFPNTSQLELERNVIREIYQQMTGRSINSQAIANEVNYHLELEADQKDRNRLQNLYENVQCQNDTTLCRRR